LSSLTKLKDQANGGYSKILTTRKQAQNYLHIQMKVLTNHLNIKKLYPGGFANLEVTLPELEAVIKFPLADM